MKKSSSTPISTGGTPVSSTNGVANGAHPLRRPRPGGDGAEQVADDES